MPCPVFVLNLQLLPWLVVAWAQNGWLAWFGSRSFKPFATLPQAALCKQTCSWQNSEHVLKC